MALPTFMTHILVGPQVSVASHLAPSRIKKETYEARVSEVMYSPNYDLSLSVPNNVFFHLLHRLDFRDVELQHVLYPHLQCYHRAGTTRA